MSDRHEKEQTFGNTATDVWSVIHRYIGQSTPRLSTRKVVAAIHSEGVDCAHSALRIREDRD